MGGWAQALTQGAGRAGNELEGARTGLRDERTKGSFDRLQMIQMALGLMQLQKQIQQMGLPQFEGTVGTPGGGTGVLNRDPGTGKTSMDSLVAGADKSTVSKQIKQMAGKSTAKGYQTALTELAEAVDSGLIDPMKAMDEAIKMTGQEAGKEATTGRLVKGPIVPDPGSQTGYAQTYVDSQGNVVRAVPNIVVPGLTPKETEGWAITTDQDGNVIMVPKTTVTKPASPGTRPTAGGTPSAGGGGARVIGHKDTAIQRDAVKASDAARQSYVNYQSSLKDAEAKNPRSHLALVFHAVRAMVQGAGRMTQSEIMQEAKAGSFGDRMRRWATMAAEGLLPDDQVQQIISVVKDDYEAKRMAGEQSWKYAYGEKPLPPWLRTTEQKTDSNAEPMPPGFTLVKP